jgi:hypothetical protein
MRKLNVAILALFVALLTACATMVKPETLDQRIAYAEAQVTAGYNTVADLATRKRISFETGSKAIADLDAAAAALKGARAMLATGKPVDAQSYLSTASALLVSLEAYLKEQK